MLIPFWQCFPCEQYNQSGLVLLIMIVYVGIVLALADTGMNPEKIPVTFEFLDMGWHG